MSIFFLACEIQTDRKIVEKEHGSIFHVGEACDLKLCLNGNEEDVKFAFQGIDFLFFTFSIFKL